MKKINHSEDGKNIDLKFRKVINKLVLRKLFDKKSVF